jgi:hypothetical protein
MKTKEEIDKLYHKCWDDFSSKYDDNLHYYSFVEGYTQCQEDIADKKYTEEDLHTILKLRREWYSHTDKNVVRDYINSLNKQD